MITHAGHHESQHDLAARGGDSARLLLALQDACDEFERCRVSGVEIAGIYAAVSPNARESVQAALQGLSQRLGPGCTRLQGPGHNYLASILLARAPQGCQAPQLDAVLWRPSPVGPALAVEVSCMVAPIPHQVSPTAAQAGSACTFRVA